MSPPADLKLITLDLDDTLWPCAPVIRAAEDILYAWLCEHAPRLTALHDPTSLRADRTALMQVRPDLAHDLTAVRQHALAARLVEFGYPAALAEPATALFRAARNRVEPYPDVAPALRRLRTRYRLVAITNGNAEIGQTPLAGLFDHALTAAEAGAARPDPALFRLAMAWAGVGTAETLHLGDDPATDVEAARAVGIRGVWINRAGRPWPADLAPPVHTWSSLTDLADWLLGA